MRPNIRIEIQNNLVEPMDVDSNEEGEISENDENKASEMQDEMQHHEINKIAKPEINKNEEEKLQERARRFHLNPEEIRNFKNEDVKLLYASLGITLSNETNVRFEVIHMRGIEQMNAGDILDYFLEYAPVSVEWIDKETCNVVWMDKMSAERALHFMSKPIRGMPVRDDTSYFDHLDETEEVDQSILLLNKNREIQLQEDTEEVGLNKLLNEHNSVDISEINATIPPGYWRLGKKHPKSKCLLLRFASKTDKKHFNVEQFSRYYKNQTKKTSNVTTEGNKHETSGIFSRNKDMHKTSENPWTVLAKNWDEDVHFREKERNPEVGETSIEVKNESLRSRLGSKRKEFTESEKTTPKKKVKIPRMKMYADEEEEKIKRKKILQRINTQMKKIDQDTSTNSDLRAVLNLTNRTHGFKAERSEGEAFDLGNTLKNRNKKMVFQIKREEDQRDFHRDTKAHYEPERDTRKQNSTSDDEDFSHYRKSDRGHTKPKSKVAVVIKTQKRPSVASAVASTGWSHAANHSDSESDSEVSASEESSGSEAVEGFVHSRRISNRPGFTTGSKDSSSTHTSYKSPLKIEINNDHFRRS